MGRIVLSEYGRASYAEYFSPRRKLARSGKEVEGARAMLEGRLAKRPSENAGLAEGSKPLERGVSCHQGSGNGRMNSSPAVTSLVTPDGLVHTTRHCSGRIVKNTSTILPGSIWPCNRSRTPNSEISIVDEFSLRTPLPVLVDIGACNVIVTRLACRRS